MNTKNRLLLAVLLALLSLPVIPRIIRANDSETEIWVQNGDSIWNTNSGNVGIGNEDPKFKLDVEGDSRISSNLNVESTANLTDLYVSGNTGLGTTNPTQKLDIHGSLNLNGTIYTAGSAGTSGQVLSSTGTGLQWINLPSSVGTTYLAGHGLTLTGNTFNLGGSINQNTLLSLQNYHTFQISTGSNNYALFISPDGNIGIGTSGAGRRLTVVGDSSLTNGSHSVASFTQGQTNGLFLGYQANGSAVTAASVRADNQLPITLGSSNGTDYLTIGNNGQVTVNGGVRLNPISGQVSKPGCNNSTRGLLWFTAGVGGTGVGGKDTLEVCAQDSYYSNAWRTLY